MCICQSNSSFLFFILATIGTVSPPALSGLDHHLASSHGSILYLQQVLQQLDRQPMFISLARQVMPLAVCIIYGPIIEIDLSPPAKSLTPIFSLLDMP